MRRWLALSVCALACEATPPPAAAPPPPPPPEPPKPRLVVVPDPAAAHQKLYDFLGRLLSEEYAPDTLKRRSVDWDAARELRRLREGLEKDPPLAKRERQRLLWEVFRAPRDIQTGVAFDGVRTVWLGVHLLRGDDGKYRVAWRDAARTPGVALAVGDVVDSLDGVPVAEAVSSVARETRVRGSSSFEQAMAEQFLVTRSEDVWAKVPEVGAPATLRVAAPRGQAPREVRLSWLDASASPPSERCPFWGKTRQGFLPELGAAMWRSPEDAPFVSYVFAAHRSTWGYVRFHSYALGGTESARALDEWKSAVAAFKKHQVRGLVVDQLGNAGGNVLFAYTLFSRLVDQPLRVPVHHYLTRGGGQVVGFGDAAFFAAQLGPLRKLASDADAEAFFGSHPLPPPLDFMPRSLATAKKLEGFFGSLAALGQSGAPGLSEPRPLLETEIAPHPDGLRFTGPVVVLIDGLNVAAAEWAAAALGDGGRARLFGTTTAGAGGDQREYLTERPCGKAPANAFQPCVPPELLPELRELGVRSLSHSVTVGRRVDASGNPTAYLEGQGVPPHREQRFTARDPGAKLRDYRAAILEELLALDRR